MNVSEAIERIKNILEEATEGESAVCYVTDYDAEPLKMAISALEKQEGEKPFWNGAFYECPNCNTSFGDNDGRPIYCDICGQKILWE